MKKSEQMLEEDALRFDAFLKENDEKVQEAIKKAEVEAKAKQDKVGPTVIICLAPHLRGGSTGAYHCLQSHQLHAMVAAQHSCHCVLSHHVRAACHIQHRRKTLQPAVAGTACHCTIWKWRGWGQAAGR